MSSRFLNLAFALSCFVASGAQAREFRVCADPNNLPFSNEAREGFENKLAEMIAADLGADVKYTWRAWHRSFLRETLNAKQCDVVMGVPAHFPRTLNTRPYYTSIFAFVSRANSHPVSSFDDPTLKQASIGVQMIGDDGESTPPAYALLKRGLNDNMRPYVAVGDYASRTPMSGIVDAVAEGKLDTAIVWGPVAGYFAARQNPPLQVTPLTAPTDGPTLPMSFEIAIGVRKDSKDLRDEIDASLDRLRLRIDALLASYSVPRLDPSPGKTETP